MELTCAKRIGISGYFIAEDASRLGVISFKYKGQTCYACPPFRIAHASWRPIPQINDANVELIFGDRWDDLPLQSAVHQRPATEAGPTLAPTASRGEIYDDSLPKDSLAIIVPGAELQGDTTDLEELFVRKLVDWLRILSHQWWIGQPTERQTGNLHFEFEVTPPGKFGPTFAARCQQTTAHTSMVVINHAIWLDAVSNAARGSEPPWLDLMRSDIYHFIHNREYRTAILLSCCWIELNRDSVLEKCGKRSSEMKTSSTDLLKHVSLGFENLFSRNLANDLPDTFAFLRACWIARGDSAHGRPLSWNLGGHRSIGSYPTNEFHGLLDRIGEWFLSCDSANTCASSPRTS